MISQDPRVNRLNLLGEQQVVLHDGEAWDSYQVFHQKKRGEQHHHVGIVHAPTAEMALLFAKEQYGRRQKCVNMWVVPTTAVLAFDTEDEDIFASATEKMYREAGGFKVMDRINKYKASLKSLE